MTLVAEQRKPPLRSAAVAALAFLVVLGPMTTDLYLPAFPRMSNDLGATAGEIQASLSAALLGVAVGQLAFGPLSDAIGRRVPLLATTGVHIAASFGLASVGSVEWMLALRVLQGFGAAGGAVVASAIARDAFDGDRLVGVLARLAFLSGLAPVVAPFLGSLLLGAMDWRGLFAALAIYGVGMMLVCSVVVPETLPHARRRDEPDTRTLMARYGAVLRDGAFLGAAVVGGMVCTGVFAYLSASPFVFQLAYGLSPSAYGLVFAINASAFALGSQASARLTRKLCHSRGLAFALLLALAGGLAAILLGVLWLGFACFTAAMFLFLFAAGTSMPMVQLVALRQHGRQAGTGAAVLGFTTFFAASLVSPLSSIEGGSPVAVGVVLVAASAIAMLAFRLMVRPQGCTLRLGRSFPRAR